MTFKKNIILITVTWVVIIVSSFSWNFIGAKKHQIDIAFQSAKSIFNLILITRDWNSRHGGIYVTVTPETQPNPYLDVLMRDIIINDELKLTKVNPAYMTRQIAEIAEKQNFSFHITSLNPIRPQNKPTALEASALKDFEKGSTEKGLFIKDLSNKAFFYMAPLKTQKSCLKCHAKQGYKEGDIRGGISVTLPFPMSNSLFALLFGHIGICFIGLLGIAVAGRKLASAYEKLKIQAVFDPLTGIPNRRSFSETITKEFLRSRRDGQPLSIMMCDIDNFKVYNDTYGHAAGDLCLKKVALEIKNTLKRPADFCARYGGEEFVLVLPNTPIDGAMHLAEKIRKNIESLNIEHVKALPAGIVTISMGVAAGGDSFVCHEDLLKRADEALYRAKKRGRNKVLLYSK